MNITINTELVVFIILLLGFIGGLIGGIVKLANALKELQIAIKTLTDFMNASQFKIDDHEKRITINEQDIKYLKGE